MLTVFRNCANLLISKCKTKRKLTFAILGLDDAGKTTTAKGLSGETNHTDTTVTIGFDKEEIKLDKYEITLFDLGGGKKIRDIWHNYLTEVFGIIFVIDSSNQSRMEETKEVLTHVLESPFVIGKPLLVLANKQDQAGALDELDVCDILSLESLVNQSKCPCRVESCSASLGSGRKLDKNITKGIMWLCNIVDQQYDFYNERVVKEMKAMCEEKKIKDEERKIRVKKIREEREKEQEKPIELSPRYPTPDQETGDPFKRLDGTYFAKTTNDSNLVEAPHLLNHPKVDNSESEKIQLLTVNSDSEQLLPQPHSTQIQPDKKQDAVSYCILSKSDTTTNRSVPDSDVKPHSKSTILQPLSELTKTEKVKRKKKKNNVVPIDTPDDKELSATTSTSLTFITSPITNLTTDSGEENTFSQKWNLVEELPTVENLQLIDEKTDANVS
ncbi:ADP-ribosylation factor 13B [Octopus vulgaris]|uniref:ADP-ribosylation factor 13B n=2 Tax=Octopus TaxID=6643 RepID=A0AA36AKM6_OCTVU|nr:ADP-ribosylation factor-like protein 13B [Octopus sinensis]XP_029657893.1 ADP-ribosylation factor-like protein 13B [Octopus sinensis]XP_036356416.1 ADP-ribosylation factor-like protein 13B [Octopus sinensis]XP_036356417.1 ADP-ribosylation factor-like protein 13B [Octopus sinensis]CAI9717176.1 ADP-ribosylation factor 13B [Octopus vulgaris]